MMFLELYMTKTTVVWLNRMQYSHRKLSIKKKQVRKQDGTFTIEEKKKQSCPYGDHVLYSSLEITNQNFDFTIQIAFILFYRSSHDSNLHIQIHSLSFYYHLFLWTSHQHYLLGITQFIFLFPSQCFPFNSSPYWPIFRNSFSSHQKLKPAVLDWMKFWKAIYRGKRHKNFHLSHSHSPETIPQEDNIAVWIWTHSYCLVPCPTPLIGVLDGTQRDCPKFIKLLLQEKSSVNNTF